MTETRTTRPHRSDSQIHMLSRCGIAYERRYIHGEKIPPGIAALKGTCTHDASRVNNRQKIATHEDLPASELKEAAAERFDEQLRGDGIWLNDDEVRIGKKKVLGKAKDETVEMVDFYSENIAPDYQPTHAEERFRIALPGPADFVGIIDLIDDRRRVVDMKTSGRSKSQDEADRSLQLTAYAAGHRVITGEEPSELRLDVIVKTPKVTKRQTLVTHRGSSDSAILAARINAANRVIESGSFMPADPNWWGCSEKFCGYAKTCPYFNGGKRG